jgi:Flp pilus assembly protein TadD/predicted Ser/Thr protein kinase
VATVRPTLDDPDSGVIRLSPLVGSVERPTVPEWVREVMAGRVPVRPALYELAPGRMIPGTRYRVLRWIADGGMGVVYEALDTELGREVALKLLRADYGERPLFAEQFREEARAVSRIGSEHIVQIHDFGALPDGRHFFTMEMLNGERLTDLLGTISFDRFFAITRQICKALAMAHDAGIVHRDIKPDNVMVIVRDERRDFVKLLDFGLATMHGTSLLGNAGTPWYMAPEIILHGGGDHRTDIYAFGCAAFEVLTGRPPFDDPEPRVVLLAHLDQPPPRLSEVCAREIPSALEEVVLRCLEKNPDARPPDMRALEALLVEAQIACRVRTTWDDLPLPRMASAARETLELGLRRLGPVDDRRHRRRWPLHWLVAGGLAAAGAGVAAVWLRSEAQVDVEVDTRVETMTIAARDAAAKANFVYPPAEAPHEPTAFTRVLELDRLEDAGVAGAHERANTLRGEFAKTLVRLGDEYWEAEGGRPFAIDYYAQAELFAAVPEHVAGRMTLTPGQLAALRDKAASADFTEAELVAAEPLAVLAIEDPEARRDAARNLARHRERRSATMSEHIETLLAREHASGSPPIGDLSDAKATPRAAPEVAAPATPASDADEAGDVLASDTLPAASDVPAPASAASPVIKPRDPKRAAELCDEGERALAGGRLDAAESAFERALGHDRRNARALAGLADVAFDRGSYGKSASWAAKAVAAAPNDGKMRLRLGDAYYKVQRWSEAKEAYARALQLGEASAQGRIAKVDPKLAP